MLSTSENSLNLFKIYTKKIAIAAITIALVICAWSNLFLSINIDANAATLDGISDQVEGKVQQDIGTKRRAIGDIFDNPSEEAKGALTQAKGKAKQDIGTTKNKLNDAQDTVEDASEGFVDSVKDFFN